MDNSIINVKHPELWDHKFALRNALCLEQDVANLYSETAFAIICFDIVSLRTINDGYGRKVGDMLLFAIRDWILGLQLGSLYRLESDEFGLLLPGSDADLAMEQAARIYERFEEAWYIKLNDETRQLFCSVSMGVIPSRMLRSPDDILNVIERILINASEQQTIAVYDEDANCRLKRRLEIEISMKDCVKDGMSGFHIDYQPIVNSITGLWCGLEALCRWNAPSLGEIPPVEFIPIAEQQGLIGTIGEWILEAGIKQCKAWQLDTLEDFFLDINVSPIQLMDKNLDAKVINILQRHNYPNHKLSLEITESTQLNFNNHTLDAIARLTQQNIPVALDDFGTGYSSFHSLINLPVSVLKTEKVFLDNIENDEYLQRLLETMVGLAHASGMKMTVEGVETTGQMNILMDNRVDYVQGFLFSKPLSGEELEKKLGNFHTKDEHSIAGEYSRIDINTLFHSEHAYSLPSPLYRTLLRCMQILFNAHDINHGINTVLEIIGRELKADRHVLFLRDMGKNTFTNTHEWCADGIKTRIGRYRNIDLTVATPNFIPLFEHEGMIISPDISLLPEDISRMFKAAGIKSNIAIPLWSGKEMLGYVGLDVLSERRNWLPEEVLMVHSVCAILANVIERVHLQDRIEYREGMLESILNGIDMIVCVSHPATGEIYFANDAFYRYPELEVLPADDSGPARRLDAATLKALTGKHYIIFDSIIQWQGKGNASLEYAVEINSNPK